MYEGYDAELWQAIFDDVVRTLQLTGREDPLTIIGETIRRTDERYWNESAYLSPFYRQAVAA